MCHNELMDQDGDGKKIPKGNAISFRFRPETIAKLKALAEHQHRSANNMIEVLIETAYRKEGIGPSLGPPVTVARKKK